MEEIARRRNEEVPGQDNERGTTLIELMVVILILGILAAIAIPTFLSERGKANDSAAETTVRNAMTALAAVYASENAYAVPASSSSSGSSSSSSSNFASYMTTQEPSIKWINGTAVSAINSVSIATADSVNSGSGTASPQAVAVTAWAPNGKCFNAFVVQYTDGSFTPGTYYNIAPTSGTSGCTPTPPTSTTGWNSSWS